VTPAISEAGRSNELVRFTANLIRELFKGISVITVEEVSPQRRGMLATGKTSGIKMK